MTRLTTLTSCLTILGLAALLTGCGGFGPGGGNTPNPDEPGIDEPVSGATDEAAEDACPAGPGECFYALELIDDLENPTLAPTCDKGPPRSPGADIDGAVLADEDGFVIATLGQCTWKKMPSSCENDHADLSAAEGSVTLLDDSAPTNLYDPRSRRANFEPKETDDGDYVALNGGSIQCSWIDLASGEPTYATAGDTIWVYEVGGSSGTKVEQFSMRLCLEAGGACVKETGFGSGVSSIPVKQLTGGGRS